MLRRSQIAVLQDPEVPCGTLNIERCCAVLRNNGTNNMCLKNTALNARVPCADKRTGARLTQSNLARFVQEATNPDRRAQMQRCMDSWPDNWENDDDQGGDDHNHAARALTPAQIQQQEREEAARQQREAEAAERQRAEERQRLENAARQQRAAEAAERQRLEETQRAAAAAEAERLYWLSPEGKAELQRRLKAQAKKNANSIEKNATNSVARGYPRMAFDLTFGVLSSAWSFAKGYAMDQADLEKFKRELKSEQAELDRQRQIRDKLEAGLNSATAQGNALLEEDLANRFEARNLNFEKALAKLSEAAKKVKDEEAALQRKDILARKYEEEQAEAAKQAEQKQYLSDAKKTIQERKLREMEANRERLEREHTEREMARLRENARQRKIKEDALNKREAERERERELAAERDRMINSRARNAHRATQAELTAIQQAQQRNRMINSRARNAHRATQAELTAIQQAKQIELAATAEAAAKMALVQDALKKETKEQVSEAKARESGEAEITKALHQLEGLAQRESLSPAQEAEAVKLVRKISNGISNSVSATAESQIESQIDSRIETEMARTVMTEEHVRRLETLLVEDMATTPMSGFHKSEIKRIILSKIRELREILISTYRYQLVDPDINDRERKDIQRILRELIASHAAQAARAAARAANTNPGSATAAARETPDDDDENLGATRKGGYSLKKGELYDRKGRLLYSGELVDGVPHGKGTAYDVESGKGYKAKFKGGKML